MMLEELRKHHQYTTHHQQHHTASSTVVVVLRRAKLYMHTSMRREPIISTSERTSFSRAVAYMYAGEKPKSRHGANQCKQRECETPREGDTLDVFSGTNFYYDT